MHTLSDLERFLSLDLFFITRIDEFDIYTGYHEDGKEYLNYVINSTLTIEHYKQFYKRVLAFINGFNEPVIKFKTNPTKVSQPQQNEKLGLNKSRSNISTLILRLTVKTAMK